jgi:hypothetical protein
VGGPRFAAASKGQDEEHAAVDTPWGRLADHAGILDVFRAVALSGHLAYNLEEPIVEHPHKLYVQTLR